MVLTATFSSVQVFFLIYVITFGQTFQIEYMPREVFEYNRPIQSPLLSKKSTAPETFWATVPPSSSSFKNIFEFVSVL